MNDFDISISNEIIYLEFQDIKTRRSCVNTKRLLTGVQIGNNQSDFV